MAETLPSATTDTRVCYQIRERGTHLQRSCCSSVVSTISSSRIRSSLWSTDISRLMYRTTYPAHPIFTVPPPAQGFYLADTPTSLDYQVTHNSRWKRSTGWHNYFSLAWYPGTHRLVHGTATRGAHTQRPNAFCNGDLWRETAEGPHDASELLRRRSHTRRYKWCSTGFCTHSFYDTSATWLTIFQCYVSAFHSPASLVQYVLC